MKRLEQTALDGSFLGDQKKRPHPASDDEGTSPVIGIVLLVAITLTLATAVFVMMGNANADSAPTPNASFEVDRVGPGGEITFFQLGTMPVDATELRVNPTNCVLLDGAGNAKSTGVVQAGDSFRCPNDGQVTIIHEPSGSVLYRGEI